MDHDHPEETDGWQRFDRAAFGLIYGAITVLSIAMGVADHSEVPFDTAAMLFGSVLAITLAKAFAELLSHALDFKKHITRMDWRDAWRHSRPTLAVANVPTLLFIMAGFGWVLPETARTLSQGLCVFLLAALGARVGWVLEGNVLSAVLGAVFAGGAGLALALMKFVIH